MEVIKPEEADDVPVVFPLVKITLETVAVGKNGGMQLCTGEDSIDIKEGPKKAALAFHSFLSNYLAQVGKIQEALDKRPANAAPAPAAESSGS